MVMSLGLVVTPASAAMSVTTQGVATAALSTNEWNGTNTSTALTTNIVITATAATDITTGTIVFAAPTGWEFKGDVAANVAYGANGGTLAGNAAVSYTTSSGAACSAATGCAKMVVTITTAGSTTNNTITIGSVTKPEVRPTSNTSATGNIVIDGASTSSAATAGAVAGVLTATGYVASPGVAPYTIALNMTNGTTPCGTTNPVATVAATAPADGSGALALCATVTAADGGPVVGAPITFTVSTGLVSTGTGKTVVAITNSAGNATTNYRGQGNVAGNDTAIASNTTLNAVGTMAITLTAAGGTTASKVTVSAPSVLAIGATVTNTAPQYASPTMGTDVVAQVTDASGLGVNGQVLLVSVDRGALVNNAVFAGGAANTVCAGVTAKSITITTAGTNLAARGGAVTPGTVNFAYCANQLDAAGKATITVQNISTTMANATASVSMAGRPAKVEATATGNAITAKVTDAAGNAVADGTPIRFTMSGNAGAVSTACTTSTNGQASSVVALIAASGTVIVSADYNEAGSNLAAGVNTLAATCGAAGTQQVAASVTVPGGAAASGTTSAPSATAISSGSVPAAGGFGLIVAGGPTSGLAAVACPGSPTTAAFWATVNGDFVTFVPGTSIAAVNAAFNAAFANGLPSGTPLTAKCK